MLLRSGVVGAAAEGGTTITPSLVLRVASSFNPMHNTSTTLTAVDRYVARVHQYLPIAHTKLKAAFNAWYCNDRETMLRNIGNTIPIVAAYAEWNGVMKRLTFNGVNNITLADGDNLVLCDDILPGHFGYPGSEFPAGALLWLSFEVDMPATGKVIPATNSFTIANYTGTQSLMFLSSASAYDISQAGGIVKTSGTTGTNVNLPYRPWLLGYSSDSRQPVFGADGYSITRGKAEIPADSGAANGRDGHGWFQRACSSLSVPNINVACDSSGSTDFIGDPRFLACYALADYWCTEHGTNDYGPDGASNDVPTVYGRIQSRMSLQRAAGAKKCALHELITSADSTDNYATAANQTKRVDTGSTWDLHNQGLGGLGADGVLTSATYRDDYNNPGGDHWKWRSDGNPNTYANDNLHPSPGGHIANGAEVAPQMQALYGSYAGQPTFSVAPSITGIPAVGRALKMVDGISNGAITGRQWYLDGSAIPGATTDTYVVQAGDSGRLIAVSNTATRSGLVAIRYSNSQMMATATVTAWHMVGVSANATSTSDNLTLTEPAGAAYGHTLFAEIAYRDSVPFTLPPGWTQIDQLPTGNTGVNPGIGSVLLATCQRGVTAPNLTFTRTGGTIAVGRVHAIYGPSETPAFDVKSSTTSGANTTTPSLTGITTAQDNEYLLFVIADGRSITHSSMAAAIDPAGASGGTDALSDPSSTAWTEVVDQAGGTSPTFITLGVFHAVKATAGTTGDFSCTVSSTNRQSMIVVAFK